MSDTCKREIFRVSLKKLKINYDLGFENHKKKGGRGKGG
jgi:hypothetical protein